MRKILLFILVLLVLLGGGAMFSEARAQRAISFFEHLKHTKGKFAGQPFTLLPWERQIVWDVYGTLKEDGTRQYKYIYIEVPKKNGKSELGAGAALYHTFADGEISGEVYSCAADKKQAGIIYKVANEMIGWAPALGKRAKINDSFQTIKDRKTGTSYVVLSAEAYTKHGLNLSACIFDELHAQPSRELWDVMTFGAGDARTQPIWWILTTAGDDPDRVSIGWEQHDYATKVLSGAIVDPTWYVVIYGYQGDDIYNDENWALANPSLGTIVNIESVREAAARARAKPADERNFRWLRLNQWITTKLTTWLPLDLWDETIGTWERDEQLGKDCYLGLDLSSTTDLTALAVLFPPQGKQLDWRIFWHCWLPRENMQERIRTDHIPYDLWEQQKWLTVTEGDVVDYTVIEETILEINKFFHIIELDSDRAMATMLLQRLEKAGIICVDIPQTFVSLTDPMSQIEILLKGKKPIEPEQMSGQPDIMPLRTEDDKSEEAPKMVTGKPLGGRLTHENNPVARWCFGNTSIAQNGQGYKKFVKEHKGQSVSRTKRIDLVSAWVDAMARARFYTGSVDLSAEILSPEWGM